MLRRADAELNDLLVNTYQNVAKVESCMLTSQQNDLSIAELHILECVGRGQGGACSISRIAQAMEITLPTVTVAVKRLEKKGYVVKNKDENDGRVTRVELTAREISCADEKKVTERTFVAQLTDTHCRYLAMFRDDRGVREYVTFLDGDAFLPNWGFGENNCGNETNLSPKGDIRREGAVVTGADKDFLLDIVGRYAVTIGGKRYDTICVMDIDTYNCGVVSEQFLDRNGRTVLWRRFNRDDWAIDRYKQRWSEQLPENERLTVNGNTYVHWYDCITDHIL